jgi:hypothetical protein
MTVTDVSLVPDSQRLTFSGAQAVHHFGYFRRPETRARILEWLSRPTAT